MAEWPLKHEGPCACRFIRREEYGEAEQVEWCGLHGTQRDEIAALKADREKGRIALSEFRRQLFAVPSFGNRLNKDTRRKLTEAHSVVLNLDAVGGPLADVPPNSP